MQEDESNRVYPRMIEEGEVPLISVEGTAYECGAEYARIVMDKYPGYRRYLDPAWAWKDLSTQAKALFAKRAPYVPELYMGLADAAGPPDAGEEVEPEAGCTSFGVSGEVMLDGQPISGQTKDTAGASAKLYVVFRARIQDGPSILVLAYPGEILGYGLWSTGMSIFRNSLHSTAGSDKGMRMIEWGLLALAGNSVDEALELAREFGIQGVGNFLLSDSTGKSVSIEYNAGGFSVIGDRDGIATHANHPLGEETAPFEKYPDRIERDNSAYRMHGLWELLNAERGRLTPQRAMMCLADHRRYPRGICRHLIGGSREIRTTAAVVAEPTRGRLHVIRGPACSDWPTTYTI